MRMLELLACALLFAPGQPPSLAQEAAAARRAREQIQDRLAARHDDLRARVRPLYKISIGARRPLLSDPALRAAWLRRRAAARRMILRDLSERRLLEAELAAATTAELRLQRQAAEITPAPARGSL